MNRHDPRLHAAARRHAHALRNAAFAEALGTVLAALRAAAPGAKTLWRRHAARAARPVQGGARESACRS